MKRRTRSGAQYVVMSSRRCRNRCGSTPSAPINQAAATASCNPGESVAALLEPFSSHFSFLWLLSNVRSPRREQIIPKLWGS
jgi:hypothetical protein